MPPEQVLEALARGLTNKFLHAPTQALNHAGEAERAELVALFQHIYQFPEAPEPPGLPGPLRRPQPGIGGARFATLAAPAAWRRSAGVRQPALSAASLPATGWPSTG